MKHVFMEIFLRNEFCPSSADCFVFCQRFVLWFNILVNNFVMPGQSHRFLSNWHVGKEMCPEYRLVLEAILHGIAVVRVLKRNNAT